VNRFNEARRYKTSMQDERLAIEAYATDTYDDVKDLAIDFIKMNHKKTEVRNIQHTGPTHGQMDEKTSNESVR
jgi:hypothetical protein